MRGHLKLWTPSTPKRTHLVLLGGGHTHVQVLRHLMMQRSEIDSASDESDEESVWSPSNVEVTMIVDDPVAVYSGMVPGFVAGQYQHEELEIDVVPLSQLAGARVVVARALSVDAQLRTVEVAGRAPIRYDLLSIDIGSTVFGLHLPGVSEYALASRPISSLVQRVEAEIEAASQRAEADDRAVEVAVVGAGAGGVELAFTLRERILGLPRTAKAHSPLITLIHAGDEILPGAAPSMVSRVKAAAASRRIEIVTGRRVASIESEQTASSKEGRKSLHFEQEGSRTPSIECDVVVWVAGAKPHDNFEPGQLTINEAGFLSTLNTLQVVGQSDVFAVGDCATLRDTPNPKAGVYAVRQGPVLIENLEKSLLGESLAKYTPQSDFLALLNLGDGTAIGSKWGRSFEGQWVMKLKDWIDRRFMEKFQVLESTGTYTEAFAEHAASMQAEGSDDMVCGGCAAKLEQSALSGALTRLRAFSDFEQDPSAGDEAPKVVLGLDQPDDVAAWQTAGGETIVRSVDAFRAFTDDPWLVGRVAVQNAVSDLQAKGTDPQFALALVGLPQDLSPRDGEEMLFQVLAGAQESLRENRVQLLGGHTTIGQELWVGFSVDGTENSPDDLIQGATPQVGDQLILTKPLGSGALLHAHMLGLLGGRDYQELCEFLAQNNGAAGALAREYRATAATDVTGFGLLGHLLEMLEPRNGPTLAAELDLDALPLYSGVEDCFAEGIRSTAHRANAARAAKLDGASYPAHRTDVLFDPQTSGGLLITINQAKASKLLASLQEAGYEQAAIIGRITSADSGTAVTLKPQQGRAT